MLTGLRAALSNSLFAFGRAVLSFMVFDFLALCARKSNTEDRQVPYRSDRMRYAALLRSL
jgi:hypothetical protein